MTASSLTSLTSLTSLASLTSRLARPSLTSLLLLGLGGCSAAVEKGSAPSTTSTDPSGSSAGANGSSTATPSGDGGTSDTSGAAAFFLPTGTKADNTSAPIVRVDAKGATHAVYPSYAVGGAYYAYCGDGCTGADAVKTVRFESTGTVTNALLALTHDGHPRVLLAAYDKVLYAACDANCGDQAAWTVAPIVDKGAEEDVTGEAFALDSHDRPRFLMHTHVAYLGIGQKEPATSYYTCDAGCTAASGWTGSTISSDIWQGTTLRFDANDVAKVATVAQVNRMGANEVVYFECTNGCSGASGWAGSALGDAFESEMDIVTIHPRAQMALTASGAPRIVALAQGADGGRGLVYLSCDEGCTTGPWQSAAVSKNDKIDSGYAIALDIHDHPYIAYTFDYNIALASCDDTTCKGGAAAQAQFVPSIVEASASLPADQIFLNYNCTVGGWLFHDPSIALTADGHLRVGYQARDASVAGATRDGEHPSCVAGTDMTWSRLAIR